MSFAMIWPIALIVFSNIFYNISAKQTPAALNPFASLTITYLVGAAFSLVLYLVLGHGSAASLFREYKNLNWSSIVLGLSVAGLEVGSIYMYQAGWDVSKGHLLHSTLLAICLIFVGALFYREAITLQKLLGAAVCMVGLWLITK